MSTQLIISTPHWSKGENDIPDYESDVIKEQLSYSKQELAIIAERELRETEHSRNECLMQFKTWIRQNEDIQNCIMDDNFLLRFLRAKKFSIPMAQQIFLKYLNYRKRFPKIFKEMDYSIPEINELISNGYIFVSPIRDSKGRRVIIYDVSKFDTKKFTGTDMCRAHTVTYETLLSDEEIQILGVNHVANLKGINASFLTLFSINDFAVLVKWGEQSFPMRHKEINVLNLPQSLKYVCDFAQSRLSQKLKERFIIHDSKASLAQQIDKRCLPKEWGGDIPAKEMITLWQQELDAKRKRLLSIDDVQLLSDRDIITSRNPGTSGPANLIGSFRKLEVD